ncbi:hypothetical protein [Microbacterium oxydans]|uniref:hypothetical protein n=1 Tax=Microbacterium oxydans TaxID=82380 RepID=UPI00226BA72F|nr:hypothetical protein [Microbacterium oxydans]WAA67066.1 hypothetical protein MME74_04760 [Microbacterium oxydans]
MPARTDAEERRALQRKAYSPGGSLTTAEAQRLRALEDRRLDVAEPTTAASASVETAIHDGVPAPNAGDGRAPDAAATSDAPDLPGQPDAPEPPEAPATFHGALRRSAKAAVVGSVLLLAIGIGAGGALFSPQPASIPLSAEQQQRRAELGASTYDPGSVRAIAQNDDALVWYATRKAGEVHCLVLDVGERSQADCRTSEEQEVGMSAFLPLPAEEGDAEGGWFDVNVGATMFLTADGEPMVGLQRWGPGFGSTDGLADAERERAGELAAEGYSLGLTLVGRFRSAPVWSADRLTEQGATQRCLIVDAGGGVACKPFEAALQEGLDVQVVDLDPTGGVTGVSAIDLRFTGQQAPFVTVTNATSLADVAPEETVVVQGEPGDPIEIRIPGAGTDD